VSRAPKAAIQKKIIVSPPTGLSLTSPLAYLGFYPWSQSYRSFGATFFIILTCPLKSVELAVGRLTLLSVKELIWEK
jgi:hypothetical protein